MFRSAGQRIRRARGTGRGRKQKTRESVQNQTALRFRGGWTGSPMGSFKPLRTGRPFNPTAGMPGNPTVVPTGGSPYKLPTGNPGSGFGNVIIDNPSGDPVSTIGNQVAGYLKDKYEEALENAAERQRTKTPQTTGTKPKPTFAPPSVSVELPVSSGANVQIVPRKGNTNAMVPDKILKLSLKTGSYTKRQRDFYKQWPSQKVMVYASAIHNRMNHWVSPGCKSFWHPVDNVQPLVTPSLAQLTSADSFRRDIILQNYNGTTPALPQGIDIATATSFPGTVWGGQDYKYPLNIGGWFDTLSAVSTCLSKEVTLPNLPTNSKMTDRHLYFGIESYNLKFELENLNKYFPGTFTIQVCQCLNNKNIVDPVSMLMDNSVGIPQYMRGYKTDTSVDIPGIGTPFTYLGEHSVQKNAPTVKGVPNFRRNYKVVQTHKVNLQAGGRLKVNLKLRTGQFDFFEYLTQGNAVDTVGNQANRMGHQFFIVVQVTGQKEIQFNRYTNGNFTFSSQIDGNQVEYALTDIEKSVNIHVPVPIARNLTDAAYPVVPTATYIEMTDKLVAFSATKVKPFVPHLGQDSFSFTDIVDQSEITTGTGQQITIPVVTNTQIRSAGGRVVG